MYQNQFKYIIHSKVNFFILVSFVIFEVHFHLIFNPLENCVDEI